MPSRRVPRPLRATKPHRIGRPDLRDYDSIRGFSGGRPSLEFNWERALYLHALSMLQLGYHLSPEQKRRLDRRP